MRRRKEPDSGVGSHTAGVADQEGTMRHDDPRTRTGTTTCLPPGNPQGTVVGQCHPAPTSGVSEIPRRLISIPGRCPLASHHGHYGTHKHAKVKAWLKRNPRFVPHFVPTSSSWMNLVERWFGHLDNKAIRRGVFLSVADLQASIEAFLTAWNQDPNPSCGPLPSNPFRKSSLAVAEPWSRSSPAAPSPSPESEKQSPV